MFQVSKPKLQNCQINPITLFDPFREGPSFKIEDFQINPNDTFNSINNKAGGGLMF